MPWTLTGTDGQLFGHSYDDEAKSMLLRGKDIWVRFRRLQRAGLNPRKETDRKERWNICRAILEFG